MQRAGACISLQTPVGSGPSPCMAVLPPQQIYGHVQPPLLSCPVLSHSPALPATAFSRWLLSLSTCPVVSGDSSGARAHRLLPKGYSLGHTHPAGLCVDLPLQATSIRHSCPSHVRDMQGRGSCGLTLVPHVFFCIGLDCCQPFPIHTNTVRTQSLIKKGLV